MWKTVLGWIRKGVDAAADAGVLRGAWADALRRVLDGMHGAGIIPDKAPGPPGAGDGGAGNFKG